MGKSARKKKEKKADFQKVKFKVGKKIQKGNAVDTTFKTKKIVIKEQLKANSSEKPDQSGKGRRDIKEILTRMQHYKSSMRCEALNALKAILTEYPDQIEYNLGSIVGRSMEVCVDKEESVRKAAYNLLKHLFSSVSPSNMVPFFPTIVAHLRCAMTHIVHDVQFSSLLVIDLLVDFYPLHLAHFSKQLLPDFLSQISDEKKSEDLKILTSNLGMGSLSSDEAKKMKKKNKTRTLSSDPSRDITSIVWHLHVAKRLRKILNNIWICISKTDKGGDGKELEGSENVVSWQSDKPLYVSLRYNGSSDLTDSTNRQQLVDFFDSSYQLRNLFFSLTRLLCEMWVEASSLDVKLGKTVVTARSLEIYGCIVDIIRTMWKLVNHWRKEEKELQGDFFDEIFVTNFLTHCMSGFPYTDHGRKKKLIAPGGHTVFSLNLLLCDIVMCLKPLTKDQTNSSQLEWLLRVINDWKEWSSDEAETVLNVVRRFLSYKNRKTENLLNAVHSLFKQLPVEHSTRNLLLNLLYDILTLPTLAHVQGNGSLWIWISSLLEEVTKYKDNVPSVLLKIIQCVACRKRKDFLTNAEKNLSDLLEFSVLRLNGDDFKVITNLLYWISHLDDNLFTTVTRICLNPNLESQKCSYIVHLMNNRFQRGNMLNGNKNSAFYYSFLFTVSFGSSQSELQNVNTTNSQEAGTRNGFVSRFQEEFRIILEDGEILEHQREVTNIAVGVLNLVPLEIDLKAMAEGFLNSILTEFHILPLRSVQSIFLLVSSIWKNAELSESLRSPLYKLFVSTVEISLETTGDLYRNLLSAARKVLIVPGFSGTVSSVLLDTVNKSLNDEPTCAVMGEILNQMTKCTKHLDVKSNANLRLVLKALEKADFANVKTSRWYLASRYELGLCSELEDCLDQPST